MTSRLNQTNTTSKPFSEVSYTVSPHRLSGRPLAAFGPLLAYCADSAVSLACVPEWLSVLVGAGLAGR